MANENTSVIEYEIPVACTCSHSIVNRAVVRSRDLGCPLHGDAEAAVVEQAVTAALEVARTTKGLEHLSEPNIRRLLRAALPVARQHGFGPKTDDPNHPGNQNGKVTKP